MYKGKYRSGHITKSCQPATSTQAQGRTCARPGSPQLAPCSEAAASATEDVFSNRLPRKEKGTALRYLESIVSVLCGCGVRLVGTIPESPLPPEQRESSVCAFSAGAPTCWPSPTLFILASSMDLVKVGGRGTFLSAHLPGAEKGDQGVKAEVMGAWSADEARWDALKPRTFATLPSF